MTNEKKKNDTINAQWKGKDRKDARKGRKGKGAKEAKYEKINGSTVSAKAIREVRNSVGNKKKRDGRGAPKGNSNAATSFLYASGIHPHEWALVERLYGQQTDLGAILAILGVKLDRAVKAQARWEEQAGVIDAECNAAALPIDEHEAEAVTIRGSEGIVHTTNRAKVFRRRKDFSDEIKSLSRLITEITLRQAELRQLTITEDIRTQLASELRKDALAAGDDVEGTDD